MGADDGEPDGSPAPDGPADSDGPADPDAPSGSAAYVFRAELRLDPDRGDLAVDPGTVAVTVTRVADPPGEPGWRFFRDHCWRGELADPAHLAETLGDALGVPVETVSFSELRTDEAYLESLRAAIGADLASFKDESVEAVLSKYLGSSIRVTPTPLEGPG